jgi:hypothetical protein
MFRLRIFVKKSWPMVQLQSQPSMVREGRTMLALICYVGRVSMHREMHAVLIGLLVIVLASAVILFVMKMKKTTSLDPRYAFISAHPENPTQRQA